MHRLAAFVAVLCLAFTTALQGQRLTNQRDGEPVFADPGGTRLGRLAAGTSVASGPARQGFTAITLEGWIFSQSVQRADRDGHNLQVNSGAEENLRATPNGRIIARLVSGAYLDEIERQRGWVRVRRALWIATPAPRDTAPPARAPAVSSPAPSTQSPAPDLAGDSGGAVDPRRGITRRRIELLRAPEGTAAATLEPGTTVRVTARVNGWARVEAQGWVRESEVRPADQSILTGVSAAELRNAPEEFRGKLLRWTIQYIALQSADELRPDFTPGQKYILARGPAPEYAFVYIAVPDARLEEIRRLEPLASVNIVARVLNGRSAYLSNPILELVDISQ